MNQAIKILVVYFSYTNNNEKLAQLLQKRLACDLLKIEELKGRTGLTILMDLLFNRRPSIKVNPYRLKNYDHIIFVAPIWAGKIASPLKTFLLCEKSSIREYSFITLCGGSKGQKEKIWKELATLVDKEPFKVCELWINDLLTPEKKDTIKHTSGYRITYDEFKTFEKQIGEFLDDVAVDELVAVNSR